MNNIITNEIFPKVLVYKNMFTDIKNTLKVIKESESSDTSEYITKWGQWGDFGTIAKTAENFEGLNLNTESAKNQFKILTELFENYNLAAKDYIQRYKNEINWPDFIGHFNLDSSPWIKARADILKYDVGTQRSMSLYYHVDQNRWSLSSAGPKFVLTITVYLTDDYEGGEISFLNDETNEILTYKPQAGDIVVFPSFYPYHHGVMRVLSGEKYLFRMFVKWNYEGDKEWNALKEKYGIEQMEKMDLDELERKSQLALDKFYNSENPDASYEPNVIMPEKNKKTYTTKYIDGRDLK